MSARAEARGAERRYHEAVRYYNQIRSSPTSTAEDIEAARKAMEKAEDAMEEARADARYEAFRDEYEPPEPMEDTYDDEDDEDDEG